LQLPVVSEFALQQTLAQLGFERVFGCRFVPSACKKGGITNINKPATKETRIFEIGSRQAKLRL
jgi:hypothetical protein